MRLENVELHNIADRVPAADGPGNDLLRIPDAVRVTLNDLARYHAFQGAAAEIRFSLAAGSRAKIVLEARDAYNYPPLAIWYQGEFYCGTHVVQKAPTEIVVDPAGIRTWQLLPELSRQRDHRFDGGLTRIVLPHMHATRVIAIEGDVTPPRPEQVPARRYLSYGSSITQGAHAVVPTGTYAMQAARHLGADLVNLGFGGGAHMEKSLAEYIVGRGDWDVATLEMGINVGDWPTERFHAAVETFVKTIAAAHRDKWVFCIDLFTFAGDLDPDHRGNVGFREAVGEVVRTLNYPRLVHLDGRSLLTDIAGLGFDLVHPGDDGMIAIGRRLATRMREIGA